MNANIQQIMSCSCSHEPNAETIEALQESRKSSLESYRTLDDFWKAMEPNLNVSKHC